MHLQFLLQSKFIFLMEVFLHIYFDISSDQKPYKHSKFISQIRKKIFGSIQLYNFRTREVRLIEVDTLACAKWKQFLTIFMSRVTKKKTNFGLKFEP